MTKEDCPGPGLIMSFFFFYKRKLVPSVHFLSAKIAME